MISIDFVILNNANAKYWLAAAVDQYQSHNSFSGDL